MSSRRLFPPTSPRARFCQADTLTPFSGAERFCERLIELGGTCELNAYEGLGHLLTRNLRNQVDDFDRDPEAVAAGTTAHLRFLREHGFLAEGHKNAAAPN